MNKFKVGDKVIYGNNIAIIFGVADKVDDYGEKYAISYIDGLGSRANVVVSENRLQSAEIEVGDIVKDPEGKKCLVEHITKKTLALTEEKMALLDRCEMLATNTDYRIECLSNLELVEKGGN